MHRNQVDSVISESIPKRLPSTGTLLKISLGLIFVAILSQAFAFAETMSVDVNGKSYDINYSVTGMTVTNIVADTDFVSLIFSVDVTADTGILEVAFDRSFFDAKYQGEDDEFILLADGDEPTFTEIKTTSTSRTLSVELPAGTEDLEIIGSVFGSEETSEPVEEPTEEPTEPKEEPKEEPKFCTQQYDPVCGKDGKTYGNQCMLNLEDVDLAYKGECKVETKPVVEKPKTQCGEGTVLKDGVCVLEKKCGTGTVLKDGVCVVVEQPKPTEKSVSNEGLNRQLGYGVIAAFIITGAIALVLALMSKASKSKN